MRQVMRRRRVWVLALLVLLGAAAPAQAGDAGDRDHLMAKALDLLRVRLEAQIGAATTLREAGRLDEALEAYARVQPLYEAELKRLEALVGQVGKAAAKASGAKDPSPKKSGGRRRFDDAVDHGLRWLAAHQSPNGGWEAVGFGAWCNGVVVPDTNARPQGEGMAAYDVGVTSLALCAFLGAGYTNRGRHAYARVVANGLRYLKNVQDPEGCFGARHHTEFSYSHAMATLAMVEAYGLTGSPLFKGPAQRGLDFIALSRNPYKVWRYGIKSGENDTSVTGWMMMPIKSAQIINAGAQARGKPAPLVIDNSTFDGIKAWLQQVTDPETGRVGYQQRGSSVARPVELVDRFPASKSEAMTAWGVVAHAFMGEQTNKNMLMHKGAELIRKLPPVWNTLDGSIDMYYWYVGTLASYQVGGIHWDTWRQAIVEQIIPHQRMDTDPCRYKGSWDPIGAWGTRGGRVYSTAMMTLCAEVLYRYDKVAGTK